MSKKRLGQKELSPVDEIFFGLSDDTPQSDVAEINVSELHAFKDHPFLVTEDNSLLELSSSIKENGLIEPITVRHRTEGGTGYEIVIGHRRVRATELAGFTTIKAHIIDVDDDTATVMMVDSNIYREKKMYSEKAFSYKMKLEAMNRQGKRSDSTSVQPEQKSDGKTSRDIMAEELGESSSAIQRYIRLTFLQKELLALIDTEKVPFTVGVELSYLKENEQTWVFDIFDFQDCGISFTEGEKILRLPTEYIPPQIEKDDIINSVDSLFASIMAEPLFREDEVDYKQICAMQTILSAKNNELIFYSGALMDDLVCSDEQNIKEIVDKIYSTIECIDKIIDEIIKPTVLLSSRHTFKKN